MNGGTNVTEQTGNGNSGNGDIFLNSAIAWTSGANLTLSAFRNINLNAGISNTGAGNLTLRADNTSTGTGTVAGSGVIDFSASTGNVALLYNPASYAAPTSYAANFGTANGAWAAPANGSVSSQYTAYMLVNSAANLQNLDANDAGTYALGRDIDLSSITNFAPLGASTPFTGILDGLGHTASNLTINDASGAQLGLFSSLGTAGQVRNLNLTNVNITESGASTYIGALAGSSSGTISNTSVAGALILPANPSYVGGLVGTSAGTIQNSSSTLTMDASLVTGGPVIGGVVGSNSGIVANSNATTSINASSASGATVGGLIGYSSGPVSNSFATGSVTAGSASNLGGLVGYAAAGGTINGSYATGSVTGGTGTTGGGLSGFSEGNISESYALGSVTGGSSSALGGLVGYSAISSIADTYARGAVTTAAPGSAAGGLIGELDIGGSVATSYSSGLVTVPSGTPLSGGLIGTVYTAASVTSSYWDSQASGFPTIGVGNVVMGSSPGVSPLTTAQFQSGSLPVGFNGSNSVWTAPAGVYPYFGWQGPLVAISGTAYNGSTAIASAGVNVLASGLLLGSLTANSQRLLHDLRTPKSGRLRRACPTSPPAAPPTLSQTAPEPTASRA